jgi:HSP20 family protein
MRYQNRFLPKLLLDNKDAMVTSFDKVFDQLFKEAFPSFADEFGCDFFSKASYPKVNVVDMSDKIVIEAAVPGLTKEEINVKFDPETKSLIISADKKEDNKAEELSYVIRELKRSAFKRTFFVSDTDKYDLANLSALMENGILQVIIPKIEAEKKEAINIDIK